MSEYNEPTQPTADLCDEEEEGFGSLTPYLMETQPPPGRARTPANQFELRGFAQDSQPEECPANIEAAGSQASRTATASSPQGRRAEWANSVPLPPNTIPAASEGANNGEWDQGSSPALGPHNLTAAARRYFDTHPGAAAVAATRAFRQQSRGSGGSHRGGRGRDRSDGVSTPLRVRQESEAQSRGRVSRKCGVRGPWESGNSFESTAGGSAAGGSRGLGRRGSGGGGGGGGGDGIVDRRRSSAKCGQTLFGGSGQETRSVKETLAEALRDMLSRDNHERFRLETAKDCVLGGPENKWVVGATFHRETDGRRDETHQVSREVKSLLDHQPATVSVGALTSIGSPRRNERSGTDLAVNTGGLSRGFRRGDNGSAGTCGARVGVEQGPTPSQRIVDGTTSRDARSPVALSERQASAAGGAQAAAHNMVDTALTPPAAKPAAWSGRPVEFASPWERCTRGFGSKLLQRNGFDGTDRSRQTEYVTTCANRNVEAQKLRGGSRGGLGYRAVLGAEEDRMSRSAPCDMEPSRQRCKPPKAYHPVTVEFPFDSPMVPQSQLLTGYSLQTAAPPARRLNLRVPLSPSLRAPAYTEGPTWSTLARPCATPAAAAASQMMQRIVAALNSKQHALLESPTGTGKSIALLCSALAWQRAHVKRHGQAPQIFYGARTHTQLAQMAKELRNSPYRPTMATLGSRSRYCINPLAQGEGIEEKCESLRTKVEHQRRNMYLQLPSGGRVPYDDNAPDISMDLAGIAGSVTSEQVRHVGCAFYRKITSPEVADLVHRFARPGVGLAGGDGIHDIEDVCKFGKNPAAYVARKTAEHQGPGVCGGGGDGGCSVRAGSSGGSGGCCRTALSTASSASSQSLREASAHGSSQALCFDLSQSDAEDDGQDGAHASAKGDASTAGTSPAAAVASSTYAGLSANRSSKDVPEEEGDDPRVLACPYVVSQVLAKQAQLVLVPYNYLLDPTVRSAMAVGTEGAVVIIDEAHNVEGVCRDAGSIEFSVTDMAAAALDLCTLTQTKKYHDDAELLLKFVLQLLRFCATESGTLAEFQAGHDFGGPLSDPKGREQTTRVWKHGSAGTRFWEALAEGKESMAHGSLMQAMVSMDEQMRLDDDRIKTGVPGVTMTQALRKLTALFQVTGLMHAHPDNYHVSIMVWDNIQEHKLQVHSRLSVGTQARIAEQLRPFVREGAVPRRMFRLNLWLMAPEVIFGQLATQVHSLVLTSGTLSPLHSMIAELGQPFRERLLPFPQQALQAKHVIVPGHQLEVIPVAYSADGSTKLRCTQRNMSDDFVQQIGRTIAALCRHIPSGVLVFLPSYKSLRRAGKLWRASEVWTNLEAAKKVVVEEPQEASGFGAAKRRYEAAIDDPSAGSALLLAVYRGKMSEGISFNDQYARGVLCVGIPYPNLGCPKIKAKKEFNDWKRSLTTMGTKSADEAAKEGRQLLCGGEWYEQEAFRALNQALGRCIRHIYDYGVICLIDQRFANGEKRRFLPKWVVEVQRKQHDVERQLKRDYTSLPRTRQTIDEFFARAPGFVSDLKDQAQQRRQKRDEARLARKGKGALKPTAHRLSPSSSASDTCGRGCGAGRRASWPGTDHASAVAFVGEGRHHPEVAVAASPEGEQRRRSSPAEPSKTPLELADVTGFRPPHREAEASTYEARHSPGGAAIADDGRGGGGSEPGQGSQGDSDVCVIDVLQTQKQGETDVICLMYED